MTINALIEAGKNRAIWLAKAEFVQTPRIMENLCYAENEFDAAARNALSEIEELRILCQTYFHEGSDSLTQQDIKRIEDRIRELVG